MMPMTLRASCVTPPVRPTPVTPSCSRPIATPVSASTAPSRSSGSQRPVARSASPNGLWVVTVITTAAPAAMIIGICCEPALP